MGARMSGAARQTWRAATRIEWPDLRPLAGAIRPAVPAILFGLRLWASVCLALYVAFWLQLDNAYWAGTTAAIVCQPRVGASLRKGWFRMVGTVVGAVVIVLLTACFPQDRILFLGSLALWGAACALVATILRNFAAYAAALAGYTAAIVASDLFGATGGVNGDVFILALTRVTEICIGIVAAGIVLAGTDLGGTRRRLAAQFADLAAGIMAQFTATLALAGPGLPDTQPARREFIRRVIALDPVIDETIGESSQIRYHSPVLAAAVNGLLSALSAWRAVATHLARRPDDEVRAEAAAVLRRLPDLVSTPEPADPACWMVDPTGLQRRCEAAIPGLLAWSAGAPSACLLADKAADMLAGMSQALNGLALLVADPARRIPRRFGAARPQVPDWLPAVVNAGRAFATIGAVQLFWIASAWPNGAEAITFAAVGVILFAPRAEQAYTIAVGFTVGTLLAAVFAAIIDFAVLPGLSRETFAGLSMVLSLYLVPAGALMAQPWLTPVFTAMAANFVPILGPANQMSYDPAQFYNAAMAIVVGTGAAAMSFRLLPPLSPAFLTRRLLTLTLRDLRRSAVRGVREDWEGHMRGRLSAMPEEATPLQRAQLLAALSVGTEIMRLQPVVRRLGLGTMFDGALGSMAQGNSATAIARFSRLEEALAGHVGREADAMRARGSILALAEVLHRHGDYFDAGRPA